VTEYSWSDYYVNDMFAREIEFDGWSYRVSVTAIMGGAATEQDASRRVYFMYFAPYLADLLDRYASDHEMRGEAGPCSCARCKEWRAIVARIRGEG